MGGAEQAAASETSSFQATASLSSAQSSSRTGGAVADVGEADQLDARVVGQPVGFRRTRMSGGRSTSRSVVELCDRPGCATLISDTGSGRLLAALAAGE